MGRSPANGMNSASTTTARGPAYMKCITVTGPSVMTDQGPGEMPTSNRTSTASAMMLAVTKVFFEMEPDWMACIGLFCLSLNWLVNGNRSLVLAAGRPGTAMDGVLNVGTVAGRDSTRRLAGLLLKLLDANRKAVHHFSLYFGFDHPVQNIHLALKLPFPHVGLEDSQAQAGEDQPRSERW